MPKKIQHFKGKMNTFLIIFITFVGGNIFIKADQRFFNLYECNDEMCRRVNPSSNNVNESSLTSNRHTTLASCRLVCNKYAGLWPVPTKTIRLAKSYIDIKPDEFYFELNSVPKIAKPQLMSMKDIFIGHLRKMCDNCNSTSTPISLHMIVKSPDLALNWHTSERYKFDMKLKGSKISINITADTVYGARLALETLLQLTARTRTPTGGFGLVMLSYATIEDEPAYHHRGLLIDTARNFLPVSDILKTIDGLAASKMNVLHWHATDSQSFALHIEHIPQMTQFGAYGPESIYSEDDMTKIVEYGRERGVRVILELDTPSHAGSGWEWGETEGLGKLAVCVNQQPWRDYCVQPPCGQLNPVNPNTIIILGLIYNYLFQIFDHETFHLGGDELFLNCWNSTQEIITAMAKAGKGRSEKDFLNLWAEFHANQLQAIDQLKGNDEDQVILWSSHLTDPNHIEQYLNKSRFVIQTWVPDDSDLNYKLLNLGYKIIVSTKNAWYLDHGFWGTTSYHNWKKVYDNIIPKHENVLGGEVCMWGEYVTSGSLHSKVWPRTAAAAERLWSNPNSSTAEAESRLQAHMRRLEYRDIYPDAIAPEWCNQHEAECSLKYH